MTFRVPFGVPQGTEEEQMVIFTIINSLKETAGSCTIQDGEGISISNEGVKVSADESTNDTVSENVSVSVDGDIVSNVGNGEYVLCIKNPDNSQAILLSGNNLDLMKEMAGTASFTGE